jgi:hypothetical protein
LIGPNPQAGGRALTGLAVDLDLCALDDLEELVRGRARPARLDEDFTDSPTARVGLCQEPEMAEGRVGAEAQSIPFM